MAPRTVTPPPSDPMMWSRLLKVIHPAHSGTHKLHAWAIEVHRALIGRAHERLDDPQFATPPAAGCCCASKAFADDG